MPVVYTVGNRADRPFARWGLTLPPPPTQSPIYLADGGGRLAEVFMGEISGGSFQGQGQQALRVKTNFYRMGKRVPVTASGVWTGGISDCMVVCAAYYDLGQWRAFWFQHVEGGQFQGIVSAIADGMNSGDCPNDHGKWAVVAAGYDSGTDEIAHKLVQNAKIPNNNISVYVSGTGTRGFAFGVDFSIGLFGELTHQGASLPDDWKW